MGFSYFYTSIFLYYLINTIQFIRYLSIYMIYVCKTETLNWHIKSIKSYVQVESA